MTPKIDWITYLLKACCISFSPIRKLYLHKNVGLNVIVDVKLHPCQKF